MGVAPSCCCVQTHVDPAASWLVLVHSGSEESSTNSLKNLKMELELGTCVRRKWDGPVNPR